MKQYFLLFSSSELLNDNMQSIPSAHLSSRPKELGWPARERADAITMINDSVTKLGGKSLSKLIHCSIDLLFQAVIACK